MVNFLLVLFLVIVCIVSWLIANIIWAFIQSKIMIKFQNQKLEALYLKGSKLILQSINDYKNQKGGE